MHRRLHQPHLPPSDSPAAPSSSNDDDAAAKRGSYNCGLPKKGHSCHAGSSPSPTADSSSSSTAAAAAASSTPVNTAAAAASSASAVALAPSSLSSAAHPPQLPLPILPHHPISHLCCTLSFDDLNVRADEEEEDFEEVEPDLDKRDWDFMDGDADAGGLPARCLWEVQRRLPPAEPLAVARVCKGWRETSRRLWRAAEDLTLRVPSRAQLCFVGAVLNKCPELVRLSLRMERLGLSPGFGCTMIFCEVDRIG